MATDRKAVYIAPMWAAPGVRVGWDGLGGGQCGDNVVVVVCMWACGMCGRIRSGMRAPERHPEAVPTAAAARHDFGVESRTPSPEERK